MSVWTLFWDMHSGGGTKVKPYEKIYIEAPMAQATAVFWHRFKRNPERVTCTCCGPDYSLEEGSLLEVAGYHRGCAFENDAWVDKPDKSKSYAKKYETEAEYFARPDVLLIRASEIKPEELTGDVPTEGYQWVGA